MIQGLLGGVAGAGSTLTAVTMAAGDSLTLFNGKGTPRIKFFTYSGNPAPTTNQVGRVRITSPDIHDNSLGYDSTLLPAIAAPRDAAEVLEVSDPVKPATVLSVSMTGGSGATVENDVTVLGMQYDPIMPPLQGGAVDIIYRSIATTVGNMATPAWGSAVAVANLKSNRDYALLGYTVDVACSGVRFQSPSFNGLFPAGPGNLWNDRSGAWLEALTLNWFVRLGDIPRFNSNDGLSAQTVGPSANAPNVIVKLATKQG